MTDAAERGLAWARERLIHAPADHPPLPPARIGVIIANLGTPDGTDYWSMRRYLDEFLSDRRVIDYSPWLWQPLLQLIILTKRPFSSGRNYRKIWNQERDESPLRTITRAQAQKLGARMAARFGDRVLVDFCFRYGNPSTDSVIRRMQAEGCERLVFFPLYPQYSGPTTATANDQAFRSLMKLKWQPAIRTVPAYHDHPAYIEAVARSIEAALAAQAQRPDALVISYHGMPKRYLMQGDPYHCQCQKTTRLLRTRLGLPEEAVITAFQSRFGTEEWLRPYTVEEVARLARTGRRRIAVVAPGFSSDCVETLEEIRGEIAESFLEAGGETFTYVPCLNDADDHIAMMEEIVLAELRGWV
ncbi:MAG: ferrochelatase [Paracoccaceae bacterium]|nr:MAG: ferrochelatase [Paracoccaceae bacterium]